MRELRTAHSDCRCRLVNDIQPRVKHRLWTLGRPTAVVSMRPISTGPIDASLPSGEHAGSRRPSISSRNAISSAGVAVHHTMYNLFRENLEAAESWGNDPELARALRACLQGFVHVV